MYKNARTPLEPVNPKNFIVYDFESSGLSTTQDQITQIGAIHLSNNLEPVSDLNIIVKPRLDVIAHPMATLTTMISPLTQIEKGIPEREAVQQLIGLFNQANTKFALGYNNDKFDGKVLHHSAYRNLACDKPHGLYLTQLDVFKLVLLTQSLRKNSLLLETKENGKPNLKLESICPKNNIELINAHDAMADIMATYKLAASIAKKEPTLFQYWLDLSNPNNIDRLTSSSDFFLDINTAYGSQTRYTRPVYLAKNTKAGGYVLDLSLDFDSEEKYLFQKFNKYSSPLMCEVTQYQGDNLLLDLGFDPNKIQANLDKARNTDIDALFEEWEQKHKKEAKDWGSDPYRTAFTKFDHQELSDVKSFNKNMDATNLKTERVQLIAERINAFQYNDESNSVTLKEYASGKLPENNKFTKESLDMMNELIDDKETTPQQKQILLELKQFTGDQLHFLASIAS